jgi:hypothetical protein
MAVELAIKRMFLTFRELSGVTSWLHLNHTGDLAMLHDVWMQGAPSLDSRILVTKGYDPRKFQPGNVEERLILPIPFAKWIQDVSARRGFPYTFEQSIKLTFGEADYGV